MYSSAERADDDPFLVVICKFRRREGLNDSLPYKYQEEEQEISSITATRTILDLDVRKILASVENRYRIKLPTAVVALDYGSRGDLYVRFEHAEKPIGEPTKDGLAVFFYDSTDRLVALEILSLSKFRVDPW
jgi:hypothetical protein